MIRFYKYIMVESIKDLKANGVIWEEDYAIRIKKYGIFNGANKVPYPCCFKLLDSGDFGHCATWSPCSKREMIQRVEKEIEIYKGILEELKNEY